MDIESFKKINLERNQIIEYQIPDREHSRVIKLGYFVSLQDNEPFTLEIADFKDKNGCFRGYQRVELSDIISLNVIGQSNFSA